MSYNLRNTANFYDHDDNLWEIEIYSLNYSGSVTNISKLGGSPLTFDFGRSTRFPHGMPIFDSRATLFIESPSLLYYSYLFSNNPRQYKLVIKFKSSLYFSGFLVSGTYYEPYKPAPFFVQVQATDGLTLLEDSLWDVTGEFSAFEVIQKCLKKTGLELNFNLVHNVHITEPVVDFNGFFNAKVGVAHYVENEATYFDVLKEFLIAFGFCLKQVDSEWHVVQIIHQVPGRYDYTKYDADGNEITSGTLYPTLAPPLGFNEENEIEILTAETLLRITPAYQLARVIQTLETDMEVVINSDFSDAKFVDFTVWDFTAWSGTALMNRYWKETFYFGLVKGFVPFETLTNAAYVKQTITGIAGKVPARLKIEWAVLTETAGEYQADVYIMIRIPLVSSYKYVEIYDSGNGLEGRWTDYENYIKLGRITGQTFADITFSTFDLYLPEFHPFETAQPVEVFLFVPVGANPITLGSAWKTVSIKLEGGENTNIPTEIVTEEEIVAESNYVPGDIQISIGDAPVDYPNAEDIYTNIFLLNGSPVSRWMYRSDPVIFADTQWIEGTLFEILLKQIEIMFSQPMLYLQAGIVSDMLKFNSLVKDTARLNDKIFMIVRASLDAKRRKWTGVELMELAGVIVPDFHGSDFDDEDFYAG